MPTWRDHKLMELASQLTYSPAEKRREQLHAAIALVPTITPATTYPWDYVHFRITGFNPVTHSDHTTPGKILRADLASLIEFLSETLALRVDEVADGPVLDSDQVSRQFSVSSKTIQRWRKQGLIALRYLYPDGRRRLGFLESAVAAFAAANKERVDKSAAFTQLSDDERTKIVNMARRMAARVSSSINELSRRIARKFERSPETIRYTLRNHDKEHPETALFDDDGRTRSPDQSLRPADKTAILASYEQGTSLDAIAAQFSQTRGLIFRVITQGRAARLKSQPIDFVANPLFDHPEADQLILQVLPAEALAHAQRSVAEGTNARTADVYMARTPRDLPAFLQEIFRQPLMPHELETDAFRRMNYLKAKAAKLQKALDEETALPPALAEIECLLTQANEIKNEIVQANLRVAVHVARKHQRPDRPLIELVSDGALWLMRAAEKFDFARGGSGSDGGISAGAKFSTYASYAIMKNFARDRADGLTRRDSSLVTGQDELLNNLNCPAADGHPADRIDAAAMHVELRTVIEELPLRERELLQHHYGLGEQNAPLSLAQISSKMGLTKARVKQLEARALKTLRTLLEDRRGNAAH